MSLLMDLLSTAGNIVDTPGSFIRTALAGENPFPGIFDPSQRVGGRDLLEKYGLVGPNQEGLDAGDVAGFGTEMLLDPLNMLSAAKALKVLRLRKVQQAENAASAISNASRERLLGFGGMPEELARTTKAVDEAGKPLELFHGTPVAWEGLPDQSHWASGDSLLVGKGHYMTDSPDLANSYAKSFDREVISPENEKMLEKLSDEARGRIEELKLSNKFFPSESGYYRDHFFEQPSVIGESSPYPRPKYDDDLLGLSGKQSAISESMYDLQHELVKAIKNNKIDQLKQSVPTSDFDYLFNRMKPGGMDVSVGVNDMGKYSDKTLRKLDEVQSLLPTIFTKEPSPAVVKQHYLHSEHPFDMRHPDYISTDDVLHYGDPGTIPRDREIPLHDALQKLKPELDSDQADALHSWLKALLDGGDKAEPISGQRMWEAIKGEMGLSSGAANEIIKEAGFDAIRHTGGINAGGGKRIHDVWVGLKPENVYNQFIAPAHRDPVELARMGNLPLLMAAFNTLRSQHD